METTHKPKMSPRDFFVQLGAIAALYATAISLIALLFQTIDFAFPDRLDHYQDPYASGISYSVAFLIISFPLFLGLSRLLHRDQARAPEKRGLAIRKWLTYFTLFVTGVAIAVDLITLIRIYLSGQDITAGFLLKVLSVLVVAGIIFGYYLKDVRREHAPDRVFDMRIVIVSIVIILASIVWGFAITGSPASQRQLRFDERRVAEIQTIQSLVVNHWQVKRALPQTLDEVVTPHGTSPIPTDPESDKPYEYRVINPLQFEVCAEFNKVSTVTPKNREYYPVVPGGVDAGGMDPFTHGVGLACFSYTIDPAAYPEIKMMRPI